MQDKMGHVIDAWTIALFAKVNKTVVYAGMASVFIIINVQLA